MNLNLMSLFRFDKYHKVLVPLIIYKKEFFYVKPNLSLYSTKDHFVAIARVRTRTCFIQFKIDRCLKII
jgi:hypothetical protein